MAVPVRGGVGKGRAIKETELFLPFFFPMAKVPTAIKLEALMAQPLKKIN